jgi:D-beta-D-heptose 7-phosphate kinase/D-beta-D-heptose 1-phosphate adenosyltransferase
MEFIRNKREEAELCEKSDIRNRNNSKRIDYFNKINDKPWGKEYLAFQNDKIGIWILHVNKDQETSLHCHFKKDTILMNISGCFKINLYDEFKILNIFESIYVPRNTFHGIHSYVDGSVLMEIEIYTDIITYTDKNDLLRIRDIYNRDKNKYETSVVERSPEPNEIMEFVPTHKYNICNTTIEILETKNTDNLLQHNKLILLEGVIYAEGIRMTPGSFIDTSKDISMLSERITVLCLSNIHYAQSNKIIYSKSHLQDYLNSQKNIGRIGRIGLTSGCFDILHEGHIINLKTSRKHCDKLFLCLSSDQQIKRLKGEKRPINNIYDRLNMLIYFEFVDSIIIYDESNDEYETELDNIMNIINPDVWFKGSDYTKEGIMQKHPGLRNIKIIDLLEGKSTTELINRIIT